MPIWYRACKSGHRCFTHPITIGAKSDSVECTFSGATPIISVQSIPGQGDFTTTLDSSTITPLGDGWSVLTQTHTYYGLSNPIGENFIISAPAAGTTWIDHVVIDTQVSSDYRSLRRTRPAEGDGGGGEGGMITIYLPRDEVKILMF
jgi:hypothetical protein